MNQLLQEQRETSDVEERERILQEIARLAREEAYHIPLYGVDQIYAVSNRVENFVPDIRLRLADVTVSE